MKLYSIVDRKSGQVVNVFSSPNDATAERSFKMLLCRESDFQNGNIFNLFYQDFDLYPVCEVNLEGLALRVSAHNTKDILKASFHVDTFTVTDLVASGSSYTRAELDELYSFMFPNKKSKDEVTKDVENKGVDKDE